MKTLGFAVFLLLLSPTLKAEPGPQSILTLSVPGPEWVKKTKSSGDEVNFLLKGRGQFCHISVRVMKGIPVGTQTYMEEVRKQMQKDPSYQGASLHKVASRKFADQDWKTFSMILEPEVHQELWGRKVDSKMILVVIYTAIGAYYEQYRPDFEKLLSRASNLGYQP